MTTNPALATYIITLNPGGERAQKLLQSVQRQGINAAFFPAVDGRQGMPELLEGESIEQQRSMNQRLTHLSGSEVGCYLSHLRAIRLAYESGFAHACILEDDIDIEPAFGQVLTLLLDQPEQREFIRLMGLKRQRRKILEKIGGEHTLTRPLKGVLGTQGYLINRAGMLKVLTCGSAIAKPIDKFYDHFWESDLQAYCVEPHLIWEQPNTSSIAHTLNEKSPSLWQYLIYKGNKFWRSVRRRIYLRRHRQAFFPAEKSKQKMGKTLRKG